ncbi:MAG TPA: 3-hydroxyacyl-CoA dehydrogenase NAD-binding domain-containing protein [Terracidiphilus sp.]
MPLTIAIIGAGPLGRRLAWRAARAGFTVLLEDVLPSNLEHAREAMRREFSAETLTGEGGGGISFVSTIEDAVRGADLAIDCVPDELESKLEILWLLDRMAPPHTIFATPTTNLSIADLGACTYRPDKCIAIAASPAELADLAADSDPEIVLRAANAAAADSIGLVENVCRRIGFTVRSERAD